jgi:hypothetical protein
MKIVVCGTFCDVIFFYISPKNLVEDFFDRFNEPVEKVLITSENDVSVGRLTIFKCKIVDRDALYEVTFFCISSRICLGTSSTAST